MAAPFAAATRLLMVKTVTLFFYNEKDGSKWSQQFMSESSAFTFLPENARVPGQQGLQQHWSISLWLIAAQVVLQLSVKLRKIRH